MDRNAPARTAPSRVTTLFFGGLPVLSAATAAAGHRSLSCASTAASSAEVFRSRHRGVLGEAAATTVWPAYGQAAFIKTGQSRVHAGPNEANRREKP